MIRHRKKTSDRYWAESRRPSVGIGVEELQPLRVRSGPPCQTSCRSPEESLVKLGGSEVTRDVEVFEGEEAARIGIDVGAGEAVST